MREVYSWLVKDCSRFCVCAREVQHAGLLYFIIVNPWKFLHYWEPCILSKRNVVLLPRRLWYLKFQSFRHVSNLELDLSDGGGGLVLRSEFSNFMAMNKTWRLLHVSRSHGDTESSPLSLVVTRCRRPHPDPSVLGTRVICRQDRDWPLVFPLIDYALGELRIKEWEPSFDGLLSEN